MKLSHIYDLAIKLGISQDPRTVASINKQLAAAAKAYRSLAKNKKWAFDEESLKNPYADTRILNDDKDLNIKTILVGVDIGVGEILLADRIRQRQALDLVISHHPQGKAYASFYEVMSLQVDILVKAGLDKSISEKLLTDRMKEVERRVGSANHNQAVDAAKLLGVPFMSIHTPADNFVCKFLQKLMDTKKPKNLGSIIDILNMIPEYKQATLNKSGPKILLGDPKKKAGKILVDMTGGTEGSKKVFARLSQAGIGTLLCMHLSEEHFNAVKDECINAVIAGHIASDTLGMNLLLDRIVAKGRLKIIGCSGFSRIPRL